MLMRVLAIALYLRLSVSVTSRYSIKTVERIGLVFARELKSASISVISLGLLSLNECTEQGPEVFHQMHTYVTDSKYFWPNASFSLYAIPLSETVRLKR